ncbi:unnamed protein product [Moneuplotes crassus]|uniref:Uncharacterized protein n=1 Tax=Euplotes crassus TaxID=5936 RepID=A0AAD1UQG9_EUPCR|nr:unnamed protein product [Moneuplotes crassus]
MEDLKTNESSLLKSRDQIGATKQSSPESTMGGHDKNMLNSDIPEERTLGSQASLKRDKEVLSSNKIKKLLRMNVETVYAKHQIVDPALQQFTRIIKKNKRIGSARERKISSAHSKRSCTSNRETRRNIMFHAKPMTSKGTSRNILNPESRLKPSGTIPAVKKPNINDYAILATSKKQAKVLPYKLQKNVPRSNITSRRRTRKKPVKKEPKEDEDNGTNIFELTQGDPFSSPSAKEYQLENISKKVQSTPVFKKKKQNSTQMSNFFSPKRLTTFSNTDQIGVKPTKKEKAIIQMKDFEEDYNVERMHQKIKERVKTEYQGFLAYDSSICRSLTMNTAVVPKDQSKTWKVIGEEIAEVTRKPDVARFLREQDFKEELTSKKKRDLLKFNLKAKRAELKKLKVEYRFLCIEKVNWWDEKKDTLRQKINQCQWEIDFEELETDTLNHMIDRDNKLLDIRKIRSAEIQSELDILSQQIGISDVQNTIKLNDVANIKGNIRAETQEWEFMKFKRKKQLKNAMLELERFTRLKEIFELKKVKIEQEKQDLIEYENKIQFYNTQMNKKHAKDKIRRNKKITEMTLKYQSEFVKLRVNNFETFLSMKPNLIKVDTLEEEYQQKLEKMRVLETKLEVLKLQKLQEEEQEKNKLELQSKALIEKNNLLTSAEDIYREDLVEIKAAHTEKMRQKLYKIAGVEQDKSVLLPIAKEAQVNFSNLINSLERLHYVIKTNGFLQEKKTRKKKKRKKSKLLFTKFTAVKSPRKTHKQDFKFSMTQNLYNTLKSDTNSLHAGSNLLEKPGSEDKSDMSSFQRSTELAEISESENVSDASASQRSSETPVEIQEVQKLDLYNGKRKYLLSIVGNIMYRLNHDPLWLSIVNKSRKNSESKN